MVNLLVVILSEPAIAAAVLVAIAAQIAIVRERIFRLRK